MFGKPKNKIDSKFRYQNRRFKRQLKLARGYKRPTRVLPQTGAAVFLSKIGLGSWLARIAAFLVFFLLIYAVFIPNVFFINRIIVKTTDQPGKSAVLALVNSYLSQKSLWPQKNLIFLSDNGLKKYLLVNNRKILSVDKISKVMPSTLAINITPRVDEYMIQNASSTAFSVSNDGMVTAELFPDASGSLPSNLVLIKLDDGDNLAIGQSVFSGSDTGFLSQLQSQLPGIVKTTIDHFELADLQEPDLTVYLKNNYKLLFNLTSDPNEILNRLRLLLAQLADADIARLRYVDMRFTDRGYVCYKNTPCALDAVVPNNSATSSLLNISN